MRWVALLLLAFSIPSPEGIEAQPKGKEGVSDFTHRLFELEFFVENLENTVEQMQNLLENQQVIIETLREKQIEYQQQAKESLQAQHKQWESQVSSFDKKENHLSEEMKQWHTFVKETQHSLQGYKEKIENLEHQLVVEQKKNQQLENAMQTLLRALEIPVSLHSTSTYEVQLGDTLDKIALKYKTTVKALKEANGLTSDKIIVGKKLTIPEPPLASRS